jgi:CRP/FNR family transcriptional regulator, cyclic AMP receptor protein
MPFISELSSISFHRDMNHVAAVPVLSKSLSPAASRELDEVKRRQFYSSGSVLFHQGTQPQGVFIVTRGTVKLSMTSSKGRAVILAVAGPGEMLALSFVLSNKPCMATAEALEGVEVAYVDREQFLRVLVHNPEAALSAALHVCASYEIACRQISLLGLCRSASERLAQFLLNWASPEPSRDAPSVWLGLTHEEISQAAGTTRETVTRTLMDFRRRGWASLASSNLLIQDREAIENLVA